MSVVGAVGVDLLPEEFVYYLGLLPLALGLRAAWTLWRGRGGDAALDRPALARWGHIALPVVLIGIGVVILVEGRTFGL